MALFTYDPKQISVVIGGHIVSGYADGTFVKVMRNEDAFTTVIGADGEVTRVKTNNKSGRIEVTIQQSSASNDVFSAYAAADELSNSGIVPALVKDLVGRSLATAARVWVVKQPEAEMAKGMSNRTWVFETDELIQFTGGNVQ